MADSGAAAIGEIVNGRYEVMQRLGEGTYFQVFKARDRSQNRMVALKLLRPELAGSRGRRDRLVSEEDAVLNLIHPGIARVYEAAPTDSTALLATEYARGISLKERLRRAAPLPLAVAIDIAIAIVEALEFAHDRGVVHGDLRSQNVLLTEEGEVKVTDFSVASLLGPTDDSGSPSLRAIPYMAPEVVEGLPPTPASDIYALGVILYEMLTGILPFEGKTAVEVALRLAKEQPVAPGRINVGIPHALDGIVLKCLQKDPARRYRSVPALLKDLRAAQDALRFGRSLDWSPTDTRAREREPEEIEEVPPAVSTLSTLNKILFAIVVLGLGTVALLCYFFLFKSNPDVRLPELAGLDRPAAQKRLDALGVVPHFIEEWNDKIPAGQIYKTYPAYGTAVKPGSDVTIWISKGPEMAVVPDVTHMSSSAAVRALSDVGLKVGAVTEEYDPNAPKGRIMSQDPEAGKTVPPGTSVSLVKSLGLQPEEAPPPDTTGSEPPPPGDVNAPGASDTTAGPEAGAGTAGGGAPATNGTSGDNGAPGPANGSGTADNGAGAPAAAPPTPTGPKRRFQVHVDVPPGQDPQLIRIEVTDDTGAHIRYEGRHHPGESFDRIVSGVGDPIVLRVYSGDTVIFEETRSKGSTTP